MIVFPTAHEGGALAIRQHEGKDDEKVTKEWVFDSSALLADCTESSIAYVAFFSDVEHEVLPVTSGHRVTITYNLYFTESASTVPKQPRGLSLLQPVGSDVFHVMQALQRLLDDPHILPEGGTLGFGLRHQYPRTAES